MGRSCVEVDAAVGDRQTPVKLISCFRDPPAVGTRGFRGLRRPGLGCVGFDRRVRTVT